MDSHVHVIVPEILRNGRPGEEWRPRVRRHGAERTVEFEGRTIHSMVHEVVDIETLLAVHARAGIDGVIVCPWVPLLYPDAEPETALERCRIQNHGLERIAGEYPDRVAALGVVPLQDPELAAQELRELRARGILGGVEVSASVRGLYLGEPRFEPFWAAAAQTGSFVFIHPTTRGFGDRVFSGHYLWNTVGNPFETTIAAAQMTMAGVMERHPELRVLLAHGGGAVLALRGRLAHAHSFQPDARGHLGESPVASIRRFYFDTITHDRDLLAALVDFAGPERVLLGSDYPFDMAEADPVGRVRSLHLDDGAERAILGANATRLLAGARDATAAAEGPR